MTSGEVEMFQRCIPANQRAAIPHARLGRGTWRRRGFVLLEVVLAVALLLMGMVYIGAQLNQTHYSSYETGDLTRLLMLTESKLAELDAGLIRFAEEADQELEGDFTIRFPSYGWRMRFDESATEGLRTITLQILYSPREDLEEEFDHDNAVVLHTVYTMRPDPAMLDVETDLGLNEEGVQRLSETLPAEFFDPPQFDPSALSELPFEDIVEILPPLLDLFGGDAERIINSLPPELRAMVDLESLGLSGRGGSGRRGGGEQQQAGGGQPADGGGQGEELVDPESGITQEVLDTLSDEDLEMFGISRESGENKDDRGNRRGGRGGRS